MSIIGLWLGRATGCKDKRSKRENKNVIIIFGTTRLVCLACVYYYYVQVCTTRYCIFITTALLVDNRSFINQVHHCGIYNVSVDSNYICLRILPCICIIHIYCIGMHNTINKRSSVLLEYFITPSFNYIRQKINYN